MITKNETKKSNIITNIRGMGFAGIYNKYGTILIFISIFILASISSPYFFTVPNLTNVLRQMVVVTLLALGVTFIIILGHIDVSLGSVCALTGCISASVMSNTQNLFLAILAGIGIGLIVGFINGFVVTTFNIPAFIMTLAMTTIARGAVLLYTKGVPVKDLGIFNILGQGYILKYIPISVLILLVLAVIAWTLLNKTKFGRYVYAVGGNASAARASGINVKKVVMLAFLFNGITAAVAGIVLMSRINSGQPMGGIGYEFDAITACVVGGSSLMGGIGNINGTVIGAMIIAVINNNLNLLNVNAYWQMIAKGTIIAIAVIMDVKTKTAKSKKKV